MKAEKIFFFIVSYAQLQMEILSLWEEQNWKKYIGRYIPIYGLYEQSKELIGSIWKCSIEEQHTIKHTYALSASCSEKASGIFTLDFKYILLHSSISSQQDFNNYVKRKYGDE